MCPERQTGVSEECQLQRQTSTRSQNRSSLDQGRPLNFLPQSSTVMSSKMENKWFYMGLKSLKKCNPEGSRAGKIPMIIFGNPSSVSSLSRLFHCCWAVILGGAAVRVGENRAQLGGASPLCTLSQVPWTWLRSPGAHFSSLNNLTDSLFVFNIN